MELSELLDRVQAAVGGSETLDVLLTEVLDNQTVGERGSYTPYSRSIDSAVALVENRRPGWNYSVTSCRNDLPEDQEETADYGYQGNVWPHWHPYDDELDVYGYANTPSLALVAALVKSLMQGETQ